MQIFFTAVTWANIYKKRKQDHTFVLFCFKSRMTYIPRPKNPDERKLDYRHLIWLFSLIKVKIDIIKYLTFDSIESTLHSLIADVNEEKLNRAAYPTIRVTVDQQVYCGVPVKINAVRQTQWLSLMASSASSGSNAEFNSITYLPISNISALTVENADHVIDCLTSGAPLTINPEDAPTKLALDRLMLQLSKDLESTIKSVELNWSADSDKPEAKYLLQALMSAVKAAIGKVTKDQTGIEALSEIQKLVLSFKSDVNLIVDREGSALYVSIGNQCKIKNLSEILYKQLELKL